MHRGKDGGVTANAERQEATFATWADAREPELQRTAHLLTGDLRTARAVVESALVSVLASATREDPEDLDPVALRALVAEVLADRTSTLDHDVGDGVDPRQALVWDFLSTLSPARRAALVLRLYRHLGAGEVAGLLGGSPDSVADEVAAALDDLAGMLGLPAAEADREARRALAERAEATPIVPTSLDTVRAHGRRRRSRRTRGGLLLAGAALVAVAVPVAALSGGGLPAPPPDPVPAEPTPADAPSYAPEDRVPPPWVLPAGSQTFRIDLQTRCSAPADEEFRSITTIRSGCRTFVIKPR